MLQNIGCHDAAGGPDSHNAPIILGWLSPGEELFLFPLHTGAAELPGSLQRITV